MKYKYYLKMIFFLLIFSTAAAPVYAVDDAEEQGRIVILLYHDLVRSRLDDKDDKNYCTTDRKFERDIKDALKSGYSPLNLSNYYEKNYDKNSDYFIVTFDDGYLSNYTVAFPILKKFEVYGDIFLCTDNTELDHHFSWRQGQIMEDSGLITLYSHTPEHQRLYSTTLPEFLNKIKSSQKTLSVKLSGYRLPVFAYPGGEYSKQSVKALFDMGIVIQLVQNLPDNDCDWDYNAFGLIKRYNIGYETDITELLKKAK